MSEILWLGFRSMFRKYSIYKLLYYYIDCDKYSLTFEPITSFHSWFDALDRYINKLKLLNRFLITKRLHIL